MADFFSSRGWAYDMCTTVLGFLQGNRVCVCGGIAICGSDRLTLVDKAFSSGWLFCKSEASFGNKCFAQNRLQVRFKLVHVFCTVKNVGQRTHCKCVVSNILTILCTIQQRFRPCIDIGISNLLQKVLLVTGEESAGKFVFRADVAEMITPE